MIPHSQLPNADDNSHSQIGELVKIQNKQLIVNRVPIVEDEKVQGTIFTFQEVSDIQSMEERIRRASHAKGLFAKLGFQDIVGNSKTMREVVKRAQRFAATDETIFITGESGTGKEIFAQSIHKASRRNAHPFLAINCSAIAPSLLESELFGYAEGSFTGARRGGKQGVFELAHHGTIFLDEIGELPQEAQAHLLRVLQEKEVMRLGDAKVIPVDVRVIAATNRSLEKALQQGVLRVDIYHRLNVLRLSLPPLREYPEDILLMAEHFITQWCPRPDLVVEIMKVLNNHSDMLKSYAWPGNVRELQNLMRRIVALIGILSDEPIEQEITTLIKENILSLATLEAALTKQVTEEEGETTVAHVTADLICRQYEHWRGSQKELARKLGIGRTTLWRKLKDYKTN